MQKESAHHTRLWAILGLLAITLSGIAPIVLLAGRASIYADLAIVKQWFTPVLVLHVNLSVGLWFLAMAMALWQATGRAAQFCLFAAILCIAIAPLAGGEAYTSNYIPVQNNAVFFLGLGFAFASLMLGALQVAFSTRHELAQISALTLLTALACFVFSVLQHQDPNGSEGYYEAVFWAGGHLLQFVYVQAGMLAWLMLAERVGMPLPPMKLVRALFLLLWVAATASLHIYWQFNVQDAEHIGFFTRQMYWLTGPIPAMLSIWLFARLPRMHWREHPAAAGCLIMSLILFLYGGGLGFMIEGSNVTIPAHYHGSTVGITIALMGAFYLLFPGIKGRLAAWQPWIYGVGQLMHVTGLAVAGGHNIARKTAGSLTEAEQGAAAALQVMRLGGILAVIGGGLFVLLAIIAIKKRNQ